MSGARRQAGVREGPVPNMPCSNQLAVTEDLVTAWIWQRKPDRRVVADRLPGQSNRAGRRVTGDAKRGKARLSNYLDMNVVRESQPLARQAHATHVALNHVRFRG